MKTLLLLNSQGDRALIRKGLAPLKVDPHSHSSVAEAEKDKNYHYELIILDENFFPDLNSLKSFVDKFYAAPELKVIPYFVAIATDGSPAEKLMEFRASGIDIIFVRPLGMGDIEQKLEQIVKDLREASPTHKLLLYSKVLLAQKLYAKAQPIFDKLLGVSMKQEIWSLLAAKCYIHLEKEQIGKGLELLEDLAKTYPKAYPLLDFRRTALHNLKRLDEAFKISREIYQLRTIGQELDKTLALGLELGKAGEDELRKWLSESKDLNVQKRIAEELAKSIQNLSEARKLIESLGDSAELKQNLGEAWKGLLTRLPQPQANAQEETSAYLILLECLLDCKANASEAIDVYTEIAISRGEIAKAASRVAKARELTDHNANYCSAEIRLAFAENRLRDASNFIQQGRRLVPTDPRWDPYSEKWSANYKDQQDKQAA